MKEEKPAFQVEYRLLYWWLRQGSFGLPSRGDDRRSSYENDFLFNRVGAATQ